MIMKSKKMPSNLEVFKKLKKLVQKVVKILKKMKMELNNLS